MVYYFLRDVDRILRNRTGKFGKVPEKNGVSFIFIEGFITLSVIRILVVQADILTIKKKRARVEKWMSV